VIELVAAIERTEGYTIGVWGIELSRRPDGAALALPIVATAG
jgi:hypothetical protein